MSPFTLWELILLPIVGPAPLVIDKGAELLFGSGDHPNLPPPPHPPTPPAANGEGPTQDAINKINTTLAEMHKQIEEMHKASEQALGQTGANSAAGRALHDQILSGNQSGLGAPGGTPEAEQGRLSEMQRKIDELSKNVQDKAGAANSIADGLRNFGAGMTPGGMPGFGGGGMAPGLSGLGGGGLGAPAPLNATGKGKDPLKPSDLTRPDEPLKPPPLNTNATPVTPPNTAPAAPAAPPAGTPPPTNAAPAVTGKPNTPAPPPAASKDITLPSGQVVTARNPQAADAVRQALKRTPDSGDVATAAYAGTGVNIPTDGADPGRKVDPADVKPGDIAVFSDHTAIVAGNGQLIGPDGKLQPLGVINDMPGFKGFFDPTATTADTPATQEPPAATATNATPATPPTGTNPVPGAALAAAPAAKPQNTDTKPSSPGFGLPAQPSHGR
ncbi:hypothetical protein AOT93_26555 [Mycobacteroides sp. H110]|nr:hypothetical protein AOT87_17865 [Mycobacteroides sp. H003]KRQ39049.1 hypothetical protein AOT91_00235 [Mycobacteroides sp. H092]KRQ45690.1 hypothetical protein AOT88_19775 [Mycobacteroides sp. H063]KRQ47773.1 hypothetical protein AOT92_00435 [Mycobacteroides sp. H101]KRQ55475.1 hypothetical protein AOT90_28200 [Mycobacteroides sp. H079]KRQ73805.1 hypothetical protein AOT93_26555 [Mycobacteroides sp. H110]KRQ75311.1 hypothetical protein AOT95_26835 [Mycobacteroides sp. HXXIII]